MDVHACALCATVCELCGTVYRRPGPRDPHGQWRCGGPLLAISQPSQLSIRAGNVNFESLKNFPSAKTFPTRTDKMVKGRCRGSGSASGRGCYRGRWL